MKKAFAKGIAVLASISLAVLGTAYTNKEQPFSFTAEAAGYQAIKINCCYFIKQQGYYSYFYIQVTESNFGHKGVNKAWNTYSTGIPQYKVDPYFNPWDWSPWMIYNMPKDQLGTYNTQYWQAGSIVIK